MHWTHFKQGILAYLRYLLKAKHKGGHGIHSPFCYYFITEILEANHPYYAYEELNKLRKNLKKDNTILEIQDHGAGPKNHKASSVKKILTNSVLSKKQGELLFRIAEVFNVKRILELGTSLGLSSSYLAKANSEAVVISIEGCPTLAQFAQTVHLENGINNVTVVNALFDDVLDQMLQTEGPFDLIYVDGNHTYEATLRYVKTILQFSSKKIVIILDDIHWSLEMEQMWEKVILMDEIRLSLDLFHLGILFLNPQLQKEHFVVRF